VLLAEGLAARKSALAGITTATARLTAAAVVYEDEKDEADSPSGQRRVIDELVAEVVSLNKRINGTNNLTTITWDGTAMTLMEAIAEREGLLKVIGILDAVLASISVHNRYRTRTVEEIKQVRQVNSKELREERDMKAARVRRLDMAMQAANWTTELL
jgi:hypothetical protein